MAMLWHTKIIISQLILVNETFRQTINLSVVAINSITGKGRCVDIIQSCSPGGRVTKAVGTIFRKIFVGTRAHPI